jgi:hypothetical protein
MIAAGSTTHTIPASAMEIVSFLYGNDIDRSERENGGFWGFTELRPAEIAANTLIHTT